MPVIPVLPNQCESDQDKLLYNIWQTIIGGALIPGIVSTTTPYGFDVNSTTNQLLYNIQLAIGGGGGGGITSIDVLSNTLDITGTSPNPIVPPGGQIQVELFIENITRSDFQNLVFMGQMRWGTWYNITDPIAPLDVMYIQAIDGSTLNPLIVGRMGAFGVRVGWDYITDELNEIYCPAFNNRVSRRTGSTANCIETFDVSASRHTDCNIIDCDYTDDGTTQMRCVKIGQGCDILLLSAANVDNVNIEGGCRLIANGCNFFKSNMGSRVDLVIDATGGAGTGAYDCCEFFIDAALAFDIPFSHRQYRPYLNENQILDAGAGPEIAGSVKTTITVSLDCSGGVVANCPLKLPVNGLDGQVFIISVSDGSIGTLTLDPNGHFITDTYAAAMVAGQQLVYYFDAATDTYIMS